MATATAPEAIAHYYGIDRESDLTSSENPFADLFDGTYGRNWEDLRN